MADIKTRLVIIKTDGKATVYPRAKIDTDSTAGTIVQDIREILNLSDEYELYIKVSPNTRLSSIQSSGIEGVAVLPVDIKLGRSVDLG